MTTVAPALTDDAAEASVDDLVRTHLPLVGHIVRDVISRVPSHVSRDELRSAGMLALVLSAKSFNSERGVPFSHFAAIRIRGALTDELRSMDWASRAVRGRAREMDTVRNELTGSLGRTPTRDEVARAMGTNAAQIDALEADTQRAALLSLNSLTQDEGTDFLPAGDDGPERLLLRREQIGYLHDAIAELPDRLRTVVSQYFFEQRRMADIAADLGVTESRVSQMRSEALALLRSGMQAGDDAATPARPARGREAARQAYCAAVATRSTLASRLEATTLLGDARAVATVRRAG